MSGLARVFNNIIQKELQKRAAWFPITNTHKVGDFGFIENGEFRSLGNIKDRYPDLTLQVEEGPKSKINFTSEGTSTIKLDANGSAVAAFDALGNAKAKLKFQFGQENSCIIKAEISTLELKNLGELKDKLNTKTSWKRNYKIISKVVIGEKAVVVCAREAGAEIELSGSADILAQVEGGKAEAGITAQFTRKSGFDVVGETGVLAFELSKSGFSFLGKDEGGDSFEVVTGELEDDF